MTYSTLINGSTPIYNKCNAREGAIKKITPHHMAGNMGAAACAKYHRDSDRQASANYYIGSDGAIWGGVPEEYRAWTSSSWDNDNQAITIEVANSATGGNWPISDAAFNSLIRLCKDICERYGIKLTWTGNASGTLTCHDMFAATNCPGLYLKSKFPELVQLVNGTTASQPVSKKSVDEIAKEVINGKWGNGGDRKNRLAAAGYDYNAVQAKVNALIGQKAAPATPAKKSNDVIAQEVINGKWGYGQDRINRLKATGYDPNAIQALVNQKLGGSKKSNETIANEVIQGKWGNGADRKNRLTKAGYDYNAIQAIVNRKLG
ncbi:N-acetylmuramoyl-L-alanine amidase [Allobaculum mucilyticum]|uniref:N-acetylmuramoyl-L-alanine amidase n=1 Tax=Allobaculum mucilyticum TaxID=2834459 RepID=UPI001E555E8C|nr:N-acetylmuramoyl-L-alanine amidase [Allobaculum mucilyticum]UNT96661.1 N-acetylmuramoyl-L-alanine amidase [Allobaculum mucilyticum]